MLVFAWGFVADLVDWFVRLCQPRVAWGPCGQTMLSLPIRGPCARITQYYPLRRTCTTVLALWHLLWWISAS